MQIEDILNTNKIIGVIGNSGSGKSSIINKIKPSKKIGIIDSNVVKCDIVKDQIEYYVREYNYRLKELQDRENEIITMLEIDKDLLDKSLYSISESELYKVMIASIMLCNPDNLVFDEVLFSLDYKSKTKILKLLMKLKKFFNKTIIIICPNIDDIYEFIDDIMIIDEGKILLYGNKYDIYNNNYELLKEKNIRIPTIVEFINKMKEEGIKLDNVDTINELIKTVYREMR
jgi:energy-coupling factor transport system ATP-binding protein